MSKGKRSLAVHREWDKENATREKRRAIAKAESARRAAGDTAKTKPRPGGTVTVKYACGHAAERKFSCPPAERAARLAELEAAPCVPCQKAAVAAKIAAANAGLPALVGVSQDVRHAARVRAVLVPQVREEAGRVRAAYREMGLHGTLARREAEVLIGWLDRALDWVCKQSRAAFWVKHELTPPRGLLDEFLARVAAKSAQHGTQPQSVAYAGLRRSGGLLAPAGLSRPPEAAGGRAERPERTRNDAA